MTDSPTIPAIVNQEYAEAVPVDSLVEHPNNPRKGRLSVITESMRQNGFYGSVIVQRSTGYVIVGNHRLRAAREAGIDAVPVTYVDVPDEQATRIMLADNRSNDLAGYGDSELRELLEELALTDVGLAGSGFDDDDLADVIARLTPPTLDQLADQYGDVPTDDDRLTTVNLRLTPEVAAALTIALLAAPGDTDSARVMHLLGKVK